MTARKNKGIWAVIPVKLLPDAKQRLTPLLDVHEREALACAMLRDVLAAVARVPALAGVIVVTGDCNAAALARGAGARVLEDTENAGTSRAVAQAARHLAREGCAGMLAIAADVPEITADDVAAILAAHRAAPAVTLVPAIRDGGTNALACSPPDAITFCFGEDSLKRHADAASARAIGPRIVCAPRVGRDLDTPADVAAFLDRPSPTHTYACLESMSIGRRLTVCA